MSIYKDSFTDTWASKFRYKDYSGETKQHKKTGFSTKKEATEYEKSFLDKLEGSSDITYSGMITNYLDYCKARLKPTTYATKEYLINTKLLPFFGKLKLNEITPLHVTKWQNKLIKDKHNYTQTYLKTINNQLSSSFNYAVKFYGMKSNPCHVSGSMGKKYADLKEFWTPEEFQKFIAYLEGDLIYYTFFTFLFFSGCRLGEALALTYSDFDFKSNTVTINKNFASVKGEDMILTPKTEKSKRKIVLPVSVMNKIWELHCNSIDKGKKARLFPVSKTRVEVKMKETCEATGVKKIRIHDIRHSHATLLINIGTPVKLVSERLGHENIETTLRTYAHLYKEREEEVVNKLDVICKKISV